MRDVSTHNSEITHSTWLVHSARIEASSIHPTCVVAKWRNNWAQKSRNGDWKARCPIPFAGRWVLGGANW